MFFQHWGEHSRKATISYNIKVTVNHIPVLPVESIEDKDFSIEDMNSSILQDPFVNIIPYSG